MWTCRGHGAQPDLPPVLAALDPTVHALTSAVYGGAVAADDYVLVRPDRFVAAVTSELTDTVAKFAPMLNG